ncbi:MAG: hypothetical protein LBC84_06915, partial [Prevotellaceae bacterium]|nr:hypothetical protein [Prevotellaceae bacterium]
MANDNQYFKGQLETKKLPELRSEEVQEVLGWIPPWIQRAGITVLFVIVVVLLIGSWFFRYPDVIEAPLVVTSNNPPVQVNARANGKITHLLVINKQQVKESDYLAVIDNPANIHDVRDLRIKLSMWHELVRNENFFFTSEELNQKYELGDLQSSYLGFIRSAENYQQFTLLNYYPKRISAIEEQIGKQQQHHEKLLEQCNVV